MPKLISITTAVLMALSLSACGTADATPSAERPPAAARSRTDTVTVAGPTVLAYFATTQQEADANGDVMEALSDFQYHLNGARRDLGEHGIALAETYADTVVLRFSGRTERFVVRGRSSPVGYRFFAPGKAPLTDELGVMTDSDLMDAARRYFGW